MYHVSQILTNMKQIEMNFVRVYNNIASIEGQYDTKLRTAAKVLATQESLHVKWYDGLILDVKSNDDYNMDIQVYESSMQVLEDFRKAMKKDGVNDMKSLFAMAFKYEKKNMEVLRVMIDALDPSTSDATITLLSKLLEAEQGHVHSLEKYI